ncbi:hypothetical protein ACFL0S_00635, partial [Thermodesulfobacteriota bacterium]
MRTLQSLVNLPKIEEFASVKEIEAYLVELREVIEKYELTLIEQLTEEKDRFVEELKNLGLDIPDSIDTLKSHDDFKRLKKQYIPIIKLESTIKRSIENSKALIDTVDFTPKQLFTICDRLSEGIKDPNIQSSLINFTIENYATIGDSEQDLIQLLSKLVQNNLKLGLVLPSGTWSVIKNANNNNLYEVIERYELVPTSTQCEFLDIEEFIEEYDGAPEDLPDYISCEIDLKKILDRDSSKRYKDLSKYFSKNKNNKKVIKLIYDDLVKNSLFDEALCLSYLGLKCEVLTLEESDLTQLLLQAMLNRPADEDRLENKKETVSAVLNDISWITQRTEDGVSLLYLLAYYDIKDQYVNFVYQHPNIFREIQSCYPVLSYLIIEILRARYPDLDHSNLLAANGVGMDQTVRQIKNDLDNDTPFSTWKYSKNYKLYFSSTIKRLLDSIIEGADIKTPTADQLIKEAQNDHNLPPPDVSTYDRMNDYLIPLLGKLSEAERLLSDLPANLETMPGSDVIKLLVNESQKYENNPVLSLLYQNIIGDYNDT